MSGRKQFNMASWLKPPNPTIRQGLIQCQWCDLKFQSAQGYAIHKKVHIENRDPLRKRLKFGKVKLRTPSQPPQGNEENQTNGNHTQEVIDLSEDSGNEGCDEGCAQGVVDIEENETAQSDDDSAHIVVRQRNWMPK